MMMKTVSQYTMMECQRVEKDGLSENSNKTHYGS